MFNFFRRSRSQAALANRRDVRARANHVRGVIECLESRCMLSVEPSAAQVLADMRGHDAPSLDGAVLAAWRTGGAGVIDRIGDARDGVGSALSDDDVRSAIEHFKASVSGVFIPPRARPGEHAAPPMLIENGLPNAPWPDAHDGGMDWYLHTPIGESYDMSDSAGYMPIDNGDSLNSTGLFLEEATEQDAYDREAQAVLEMLWSLRYLPNQAQQEIPAAAIDRALEASPSQLTDGLSTAARESSGASEAPSRAAGDDAPAIEPTRSSEPIRTTDPAEEETTVSRRKRSDADSDGELDEGGMVALLREPLIEDEADDEAAPIAEIESLLDVPVQMDSAYGKFQAFEVSSAEDAAAPAVESTNPNAPAAPTVEGASTGGEWSTPGAEALDAAVDAGAKAVAGEGALGEGALGELDELIDEDEPPTAAVLGAADPKTRAILGSAATALVFASITRAARGAPTSKSDSQSAAASCRPKPDSKTSS